MTAVLCPGTAFALRENTGLTELRLQRCDIDAEGISHLAQALHVNTTLRVLDLSFNNVGGFPFHSQGAEHLGKLSGEVWVMGSLVTSEHVSMLHPIGICLLSKMCPSKYQFLSVGGVVLAEQVTQGHQL